MRAKRSRRARRRAAATLACPRRPHQAGGEAVGHDQPLLGWQQLGGKVRRHSEIEFIRIVQIVVPLAVGEEVDAAGFHLDRDQTAVTANGHEVDPATGGERELGQRGELELEQETHRPADDVGGGW